MRSHFRLARPVSSVFLFLLACFVIAMCACGSTGSNSGNGSSGGNSGGAPGTQPGGGSSGSTGSGGGSTGSGGGTGSGSGGTIGSGAPQGGTYVYAHLSESSVGGYRMNSDGSLTALAGSPFAVPGLALAASGTHLFSVGQSQLVVYGIDAQTGSLTAQSQISIPDVLLVAANGAFVYAVDNPTSGGSKIYAFSVAQNGTLTPVAGSPFALIAGPCDLCVRPESVTVDGKYLAVGDGGGPHGAGGFILFARQGNGAVQRTSALGASSALSVALNSTDTFLYAVQSGDGAILTSSIDANGQMKLLQDLLPPPSEGFFPSAVPAASGKYVVAVAAKSLNTYAVGSDGTLTTQLSHVQTVTNDYATSAIFDPSGHFVVLANPDGLTTFSFNQSSGALAAVGSAAKGTTAKLPVAVSF